jgi:hypothetical protein
MKKVGLVASFAMFFFGALAIAGATGADAIGTK